MRALDYVCISFIFASEINSIMACELVLVSF